MVFGVAQVTAFFKDNDQMVLSHHTRWHQQYKGIVSPKDMIDFTTYDHFKQIIDNCKRPARIPDLNNIGQKIAQEDFHFPAWSLMRLKVADVAV